MRIFELLVQRDGTSGGSFGLRKLAALSRVLHYGDATVSWKEVVNMVECRWREIEAEIFWLRWKEAAGSIRMMRSAQERPRMR